MKKIKITTRFKLLLVVLLCFTVAYATPVMATKNNPQVPVEKTNGKQEFIEYPASTIDTSNVFTYNEKRSAQYNNSGWDIYSTKYYYNQLNSNEKAMYDALDAMCHTYLIGTKNFEYNFSDRAYVTPTVSFANVPRTEAIRVIWLFYYSNPQYYFLRPGYACGSNGTSGYTYLAVYDAFANGSSRSTATTNLQKRINLYYSKITMNASAEVKEKQIHDLIVANTVYKFNDLDQSVYSSLVEGETVCAGYANAFQLLCNGQGIDTVVVTSEGHQWNKIRLNNTWYVVDCTWDDYDYKNTWFYDYFNRSTAAVADMDSKKTDPNLRVAHIEEPLYVGISPECVNDSGAGSYNTGTLASIIGTAEAPSITTAVNDDYTTVTMSSATTGARIYYTLDGSNPTEAYSKAYRYTEPVNLKANQTIRAIAVATRQYDSTVSAADVAVYNLAANTPVFSWQPASLTTTYGSAINGISVAIDPTNMAALTYQWYRSRTNTYAGIAIRGATAATYKPSTALSGYTYYYCIVTNIDNTALNSKQASTASTIARITVNGGPIAKAQVASISSKTYTGKVVKPTVKLTINGMVLKKGRDYKVSYSNNQAVGKAKITIKGLGDYTGKRTVTFNIIPKGTTFSKKVIGKKAVTVKWTSKSGVSGYQVQYAKNSRFKSASLKTIKSSRTTLKGLTSKNTYYIRIRTFKKVNGKTYYSKWSKSVKVKVK